MNSNIKEGIAFLYMDSKSKNWKLSDKSIADKNQALSYTLEQNYRLLHETQVRLLRPKSLTEFSSKS